MAQPKWMGTRIALTGVQPGANVPLSLASKLAYNPSTFNIPLGHLGPQPIISGTAGAGMNLARLTVGV